MDVFDLVAKIRLDASEYEDGVGKAKGGMSSLAAGVKNGLATVAKVGAAAVSAGVAGVTALTKMGVDGYAQYEQLVGGVETLFKDSGNVVMKYAENAYKTAGLSANAYMETVTSFSASLIQSLDGDTAKAAKVADTAITDMSDNANKMGTSMEMIQNAYNGFAKGNFMMLDNLKLGYGGTKTEMERLLADAQKLSGIKYDVSSYSDIVEAIHVIQKNMEISGYSVDELSDKLQNASLTQEEVSRVAESMGISYEEAFQKMKDGSLTAKDANVLLGTTAKEAATTIQGSLSMMKGAWENLVVGLADENANMESLIGNFVESTKTAADNLLPRIGQTLAGIGQLVAGLAPVISSALPTMIESVLPSLLNAAVVLVTSVFGALPGLISSMLPVVIQAALDILSAFLGVINENFGTLLQIGVDALLQIITGITSCLPQIIETAMVVIMSLVSTLTNPENLQQMLNAAMTLIESIVTGLIDNLPKLVEAAILLVQNLVAFVTKPGNLAKLLDMCVRMMVTIVNGLVDAIPQLVDAAIQLIISLVQFLLTPANITMLIGAALSIVVAIARGLIESAYKIGEGAVALIEELIAKFNETDWSKVASDIIDSLLSGLKTAWSNVTSWFSSAWNSLFNKKVNVSADEDGNVKASGHATGLNYVPYDNYPALLHRGEAVLTSIEATEWRNGKNTNVVEIQHSVTEKTADAQNAQIVSVLVDILDAITGGNEEMTRAIMADKNFAVDKREFARLVRTYA